MPAPLKPFPVDWNGSEQVLCIPEPNLAAEVHMTDFPPIQDVWGAIQAALENPIDCPPVADSLRPGHRVAIMTGDRFTDEMLGERDGLGHKLLDYLNRLGIQDRDVTFVYAPGSHHPGQRCIHLFHRASRTDQYGILSN